MIEYGPFTEMVLMTLVVGIHVLAFVRMFQK